MTTAVRDCPVVFLDARLDARVCQRPREYESITIMALDLAGHFERLPCRTSAAMKRLFRVAREGHESRRDQLTAIRDVMRQEGFAALPDYVSEDGRPLWAASARVGDAA